MQVVFSVRFQLKGVLTYSGKAIMDGNSISVDRELNKSFEREYERGFSSFYRGRLGDPEPDIKIRLEVKFIPCIDNSLYKNGIGVEYTLMDSYFPLRHGGKVTLYQDAHCINDQQLPQITLENGMIFKRGTCWEDMFHAIFRANHVVYIVGWAILPMVRLVREPTRPFPECPQDMSHMTLGDLLKQKASHQVKVLLLPWKDISGFMETQGQETSLFFKNTSVKCVPVTRNPVATSNPLKKWVCFMFPPVPSDF